MVIGDEWMDIARDCSVEPPLCTERFPGRSFGDCGSLHLSRVFFALLKIVCEYVMLNLFIGLVLQNFAFLTQDVGHVQSDTWAGGPSSEQLRQVRLASAY